MKKKAEKKPEATRFRRSSAGPRLHANLSLDPDVWAAAKANCHALGVSTSDMINSFLAAWNKEREEARAAGKE